MLLLAQSSEPQVHSLLDESNEQNVRKMFKVP